MFKTNQLTCFMQLNTQMIFKEMIVICNRYLGGEINVKAFESSFDRLFFLQEEELMQQVEAFRHIEAIRSAMDVFEPLAAARATDASLIDEEELQRIVRLNTNMLTSMQDDFFYEKPYC